MYQGRVTLTSLLVGLVGLQPKTEAVGSEKAPDVLVSVQNMLA